ncbi:MAG TPA: right-handed parallel beta-helix repeat-containing protein [Solirubrobacterales bacterium]
MSVTDVAHGAAGDGVTNDRAAIQSACDAAAEAGGGIVFFPAGTYSIDSTSTITVEDNVTLVGVGRGSKVKCSNEETNSLLYMFRCVDGSHVQVRNLWLDGPEELGAEGEVRLLHHNGGGGSLLVLDCFLRKGGTAIKVDAAAESITVARCEFTEQSEFGILTSGSSPGDIRISVRDCYFHDLGETTTEHAIYVPNNHSLDVDGCSFADLSGYGVHVFGQSSGGDYCRVRGCMFRGAMRGAMITNKYTLTVIAHCQFSVAATNLQIKVVGSARIVDCDFEAVANGFPDIANTSEAVPPYEVTIRGCRFFGSATGSDNIAIDDAGAQSWRIEGCDFRGQRDVGVFCDSELDATSTVRVIGNTWDQASEVDYAIELTGLGTVLVEGNEFKELRSTSGYAVRCASGKPSRLAVIANDFSQDNVDRSVSFAGTLPANYHAEANHGASGGLAWRDVASAATVTLPPLGSLFRITGTTNITSLTASWNGREVTLRFASTPTFTDGSNLRLAGNLVATADDTITLICDGTNWYEAQRAVN